MEIWILRTIWFFGQQFQPLANISVFGKKYPSFGKKFIFDQNILFFRQQFRFLTKIFDFLTKKIRKIEFCHGKYGR